MSLRTLKEEYENYHELMKSKINKVITFTECVEILSNALDTLPDIIDNPDFINEFGGYFTSKEELLNTLEGEMEDYSIEKILMDCEWYDFKKTIGDIVLENYKGVLKLSTGNYFYYYNY